MKEKRKMKENIRKAIYELNEITKKGNPGFGPGEKDFFSNKAISNINTLKMEIQRMEEKFKKLEILCELEEAQYKFPAIPVSAIRIIILGSEK